MLLVVVVHLQLHCTLSTKKVTIPTLGIFPLVRSVDHHDHSPRNLYFFFRFRVYIFFSFSEKVNPFFCSSTHTLKTTTAVFRELGGMGITTSVIYFKHFSHHENSPTKISFHHPSHSHNSRFHPILDPTPSTPPSLPVHPTNF